MSSTKLFNNSSTEIPYKYPRELFDKIYQLSQSNDAYVPNFDLNFEDYKFEHTLPEDFIIELENKDEEIINKKYPSASPKLKLADEKFLEGQPESAKPDNSQRQDKLELEDWLDQVL